jgi:hypothetical protein
MGLKDRDRVCMAQRRSTRSAVVVQGHHVEVVNLLDSGPAVKTMVAVNGSINSDVTGVEVDGKAVAGKLRLIISLDGMCSQRSTARRRATNRARYSRFFWRQDRICNGRIQDGSNDLISHTYWH